MELFKGETYQSSSVDGFPARFLDILHWAVNILRNPASPNGMVIFPNYDVSIIPKTYNYL